MYQSRLMVYLGKLSTLRHNFVKLLDFTNEKYTAEKIYRARQKYKIVYKSKKIKLAYFSTIKYKVRDH